MNKAEYFAALRKNGTKDRYFNYYDKCNDPSGNRLTASYSFEVMDSESRIIFTVKEGRTKNHEKCKERLVRKYSAWSREFSKTTN